MKRGLAIICIFFILILSLSVVSAGFFSEFWNKITGKAVDGCDDSDGHLGLEGSYYVKGTACAANGCFTDSCVEEGGSVLREFSCSLEERVVYLRYTCPGGEVCESGACKSICVADTCVSLGYECGTHGDGCGGSLDCDVCSSGEICSNGNCIEEGQECTIFYLDIDGDDYGTTDNQCLESASEDYTASQSGDCDDSDLEINPLAEEVCDDGLDNNCDGNIDEGCVEGEEEIPSGDVEGEEVVEGAEEITEGEIEEVLGEEVVGEEIVGDFDNDGILDIHDPDVRGDGVLDSSYLSVSANGDEDSDGILNIDDDDIDGDGILNGFDVLNFVGDVAGFIGAKPEKSKEVASFSGYIIEFEDKPLAIENVELEEAAERNEGNFFAQAAGAFGLATTNSNIERKLENKREDLELNRKETKERIKKELGKTSTITGNAVGDSEGGLVILNEYENVFNGIALDITPEEAEGIKDVRGVKSVTPNYIINVDLMDSVPLINADDVWQMDEDGNDCSVSGKECLTGRGITIGIIDTGVDYTHGDLGGCNPAPIIIEGDIEDYSLESSHPYEDNYDNTWEITKSGFTEIAVHFDKIDVESGWDYVQILDSDDNVVQTITGFYEDFWSNSVEGDTIKVQLITDFSIIRWGFEIDKVINGNVSSSDLDWSVCDKVVGGWDFYNDDNNPVDDHGHGTHVAATAAGNGVLKGVAPDAEIYAYKVLSAWGGGSLMDIIAAIERSMDPNQDGDFSDHLDIISLSLGGWGNPDDPMSQAIDNAVDSGVVAVISAGNSGPGKETIGSPGTARKAITVGASNKSDLIADFSSRGAVKWEDEDGITKIIIKPDITAPGVDICAAQWGDAWSDSECVDTEHTAISGTSMAAPHVSGATALLLQKNPDWTPKEVKMALRSTAVDIGEPINTQGYGRMDTLNMINFNGIPSIAEIKTGGQVSGVIDIIGTVKGRDFDKYVLYNGNGEDSSGWVELTSSTSQIENGVLYSGLDTFSLNDGVNYLRLLVWNNAGEISEDRNIIEIDNMELLGIGDNSNYLKGIENVTGTISLSDYDAYRIEYHPDYYEDTADWTEICSSTTKPTDDFLCTIDVSSFENGGYYFRLSVNNGGTWISDESFKAVVLKEMLDGWPAEIEFFPRGDINVIKDRQGNNKLIVPSFSLCEESSSDGSELENYNQNLMIGSTNKFSLNKITNASTSSIYVDKEQNKVYISSDVGTSFMCERESLYIFNEDGSSKEIKKILDGSDEYVLPWDPWPSVYNKGQEEYMALIRGYDNQGLVDLNGNYFSKWPGEESRQSSAVVFGDNLFNVERDYEIEGDEPERISINAFDEDGNLLTNFPIVVTKGSGEYFLFLRKPLIFNNGDSKNIAIISGSYNKGYSGVVDTILFLDIYSLEGDLIKRTKVFDEPTSLLGIYSMNLAAGDMNNDGNEEIVYSVSTYYADLYFEDKYDINAYETFFYILDNEGNAVSNIDSVKGYMIQEGILANLGDSGMNFIVVLSDTWPTTYEGQKIMSFDYDGNKIIDVNLEDYNDLVEGLVAGDVDADGEVEVIVNYRPRRWQEGRHSGFQIFDKEGNLEREIKMPTTGLADFYYSPVLIDLDNDGKLDIVQLSEVLSEAANGYGYTWDTRIYAFTLDSQYNSETMEWPMFQHDPQHTGVYGYESVICTPSEEICDGKDNDCDEEVDEDDVCFVPPTCDQTDSSCFYDDGQGICVDCSAMSTSRKCGGVFGRTKVLEDYYGCSGDGCVGSTRVIETCKNFCSNGECSCHVSGTQVNIFTRNNCCNGYEIRTETDYGLCRWRLFGRGDACAWRRNGNAKKWYGTIRKTYCK